MCQSPARSHPLFLKSLEIAGFKSFARPVRLEFPRGITAFVGPNGSGKSNVVDAVRWCLGEQSVRDLRAQRTEDVIYAGPRKVLGAAEVTLTFESESGDAPWTELAVGRRLYRSGESEYLVNGRRARLRDLTSALRLLGIDSGRNVIVTQGMADALLSATPLERRGLLEQAAGLGPYRERRDEAKGKLATTTQNISTIQTVLAEMEPRLRLLRRQARAVQDRDEARTMLRRRLTDWFAFRWREIERRVGDVQRETREAAEERSARAATLRTLEAEAEEALERERALRRNLEAAVEALHAAERERDAARHELQRLEARQTAVQDKLETLLARQSALAESRGSTADRVASLQRTIEDTDRRDAEAREAQRQAESAWTRAREGSREVETQVQAAASARQQVERQHAAALERVRKLDLQIEDDRQRASNIQRRLNESQETATRADVEINDIQRDLAGVEADLNRLQDSATCARQNLEKAQVRHDRVLALQRRVQAAHADVRGAVSGLSRTVRGFEHDASGLLSRLRVTAGWDTAVAAAMRDWAFVHAGVTTQMRSGSTDDFLHWRDRLADLPAGSRWADSVVSGFPADLIHPLLLTAVAESEQVAEDVWRQLAGKPGYLLGWPALMVVTRDGTIFDPSGVRRLQADERAARYLRAKRELEAAERRDGILQAREAALAAERERTTSALEVSRRASDESARVLTLANRKRADLAERQARSQRARDAARAEQGEHTRRLKAVQEAIGAREAELRDSRAAVQKVATELTAATDRWRRAQGEAQARGREVADAAARRAAARRDLETLGAKRSAQAELLLHARQDLHRMEVEGQKVTEDRASLEAGLRGLAADIAEHAKPLQELDAVVTGRRRQVDELRQRDGAPKPRPSVGPARSALSEAIARHERALALLAQAEEQREDLTAEIMRDLGCEPRNLPEPPENAPGDDEIRRLRTRANQYADADPTVIEESRDLADRQNHLRSNLQDLEQAVETLQEMMAEADAEMRTRFDRAFADVNEEFSRVFQVMLRGGEARLERIGEDGGIDIRAQLPGKRTRSSAAFSGGERSLIASALLFGVLKIRPTPFCLLDEVDAALDESNVDRYLAVLRDIGSQTQIMVVTHNRATMAAADVLYGMTMNAEGISSVLSLRLDTYATA